MRWRLAGIERATAEPSLPFFIEWGPGTPLPGRATATHRAGAVQIAKLRLDGDAERKFAAALGVLGAATLLLLALPYDRAASNGLVRIASVPIRPHDLNHSACHKMALRITSGTYHIDFKCLISVPVL